MNEETRQYWKAVCIERCTYSLEEGSRSSTTGMRQLVGFLSYIETALYVIWNLENSQITCIMWTTSAFLLKSFQRMAGVFHIINVQRRMGDWYFETAKSWEDLLAVHEKWVLDYNFQKHLAHEKREDGRHSPAKVLGWVAGKQFEPDYMYRAFSAICETRRLSSAGYARFRDFLLYGERGLAGKKALINIFQDGVTIFFRVKHTLTRVQRNKSLI
jgi:hypothetical protein